MHSLENAILHRINIILDGSPKRNLKVSGSVSICCCGPMCLSLYQIGYSANSSYI